MRERSRSGSRGRPQQQQFIDDNATVDTTTAVLQGTHNNDNDNEEVEAKGESSAITFERILSAQREISAQSQRMAAQSEMAAQRRIARLSPSPSVVAESTISVVEEGGEGSDDDEDSQSQQCQPTSRARIFDLRRMSILCVILVVIISVAVGSSVGFAKPPPSFSTSTATPPHPNPNEDGLPHLHKYAYVFVAYDKHGYEVAHQLTNQLQISMAEQGNKEQSGGLIKEHYVHPRSQFNKETKCTNINLESNSVAILESPEFHCDTVKLRSLFMDHRDLEHEKFGVKLIHLVRSPFSMAVANYQDRKIHRAHYEEPIFKFENPCISSTGNFTMTVADLNSPILSENGVMTHNDFDNIHARCKSMFQTRPGLETASYQQHLNQLPPGDGLQLAVVDGINNLALMASDLISFRRVHAMVRDEPERKKRRHLDVMTVPLEEVLNYPGNTMMDFLNFIFGTSLSAISKHKAAAEFEQIQIVPKEDSANATEMEELIGFLKNDPLFGGPLSRVESLLNSVLSDKESEVV